MLLSHLFRFLMGYDDLAMTFGFSLHAPPHITTSPHPLAGHLAVPGDCMNQTESKKQLFVLDEFCRPLANLDFERRL